jgi:hypothetical protein
MMKVETTGRFQFLADALGLIFDPTQCKAPDVRGLCLLSTEKA